MIGISLRLPKSTLDAVRDIATREKLKPTALIRSWIEDAISDQEPNVKMAEVVKLVREAVHEELVRAKLAA